MDADGDFVITWQSFNQDGSGYGVYAQRYNAAGVAQGSEFQVNSYTSSYQAYPTIGMDANGDFVIAWLSDAQDGSGYGIFAQRYNAAGVAQGTEFQVSTYTTNNQWDQSIGMDADGDFVITWQSYGQDGSEYGIYAQRYNALGIAQGSEFQVNTWTSNRQSAPSIAMDADGDFVITWQSSDFVGDGPDGSGSGIYAQRFNAQGVAQGSEFLVNTLTTGNQVSPSIAMDSDGDFVITWGSSLDIYAQRFNAAGVPQGSEFLVNSWTTSIQVQASIAMDADGDFVITWETYPQDGSLYVIYAQRFRAGKPDYLGVRRSSKFYLDSNQSDSWNGSATDTLNSFGTTTDTPIVGDWNGDGYDDIGIWRNGTFYLDANGNGIWDGPATDWQFNFGNPTDTPLAGDWNNDGKDEIGIWRAGKFYLDFNGNRVWNSGVDSLFSFGAVTDTPLIGDWNGDGTDDLGVWRSGKFYLDLNGNHAWNSGVDGIYSFGNPTDTPIVGKFNRDVADDIGVWRDGIFYVDYNSNYHWDGAAVDFRIGFGATTDIPLIGNWRPKTIPGTPPAPSLLPNAGSSPGTSIVVSSPAPKIDVQSLASLIATPTKKLNAWE